MQLFFVCEKPWGQTEPLKHPSGICLALKEEEEEDEEEGEDEEEEVEVVWLSRRGEYSISAHL